MGRMRVTIKDVIGIKFDRELTAKRISAMGVTSAEMIKKTVDAMEAAHTRAAFLHAISKPTQARKEK